MFVTDDVSVIACQRLPMLASVIANARDQCGCQLTGKRRLELSGIVGLATIRLCAVSGRGLDLCVPGSDLNRKE